MRIVYVALVAVLFSSCKKNSNYELTKITSKKIAVDSTISSSKKIDDFVDPYKTEITAKMEEVLSYTPTDLLLDDGKLQSTMGNLMADMCYKMANPVFKELTNESIDFVMLNHGGVRATIAKGNITTANAFKIMPFENEFVVAELTGAKVQELLSHFIENNRAHPFCRNIELSLKDGSYDFKIKGEVFDKHKSYKVLTSDFLQTGGDKMYFFKNPKKLTKLNVKMRDAIIDYFKKIDTIKAVIDKRVILN